MIVYYIPHVFLFIALLYYIRYIWIRTNIRVVARFLLVTNAHWVLLFASVSLRNNIYYYDLIYLFVFGASVISLFLIKNCA